MALQAVGAPLPGADQLQGYSPAGSVFSAPPPTSTGGSTGGGGGGGGTTSATVDPAVAAFLGQQIQGVNAQISALDPQLSVGRSNILSSTNNAINNENNSFGQATRDYNTQRGNTINDEVAAKQNIDTGVRQQTGTLQRLLGLAGSGNSSASEILAPYAAGRQGNIQRQAVQTNYGRNLQSTDTAYGDTTQKHTQNLGSIDQQRYASENALQSGIDSTRQSLLNTLAGLTLQQGQAQGKSLGDAQAAATPYLNQINALVAQAAALGNQYQNPIQLTAPSIYQAPDLSAYNYDVSKAPELQSNVPYADQLGPYLPSLQNNKNQILGGQ